MRQQTNKVAKHKVECVYISRSRKNEPNYEPKFTCRDKTFNRTLRTMCHADRAKRESAVA